MKKDDELESDSNEDEVRVDETKMKEIRDLHLAFIEDWWFEIAYQMAKDSKTYQEIDKNVLEYVKSMVRSGKAGGIRVKLEWLEVKIGIIKCFEQLKLLEV